jgi:hypothetical protein
MSPLDAASQCRPLDVRTHGRQHRILTGTSARRSRRHETARDHSHHRIAGRAFHAGQVGDEPPPDASSCEDRHRRLETDLPRHTATRPSHRSDTKARGRSVTAFRGDTRQREDEPAHRDKDGDSARHRRPFPSTLPAVQQRPGHPIHGTRGRTTLSNIANRQPDHSSEHRRERVACAHYGRSRTAHGDFGRSVASAKLAPTAFDHLRHAATESEVGVCAGCSRGFLGRDVVPEDREQRESRTSPGRLATPATGGRRTSG